MLLSTRPIYRTQTETVHIPLSAGMAGIPAGQGKCIAIDAKINLVQRDTATFPAFNNRICYIGDRTQQEWFLSSQFFGTCREPLIITPDLSELYFRTIINGVTIPIPVQLKIYLGENDQITINPALQVVN